MPPLSELSEAHTHFRIDRKLPATPARVFAAWSQAEAKQAWFSCHDDWNNAGYALDFRIGGSEYNQVHDSDGLAHVFRAHFLDIVPERRIIYAYDLLLGERRISVSLVTVSLRPDAGGTLMSFTEQVVFLDGYTDHGERREGTEVGLEKLAAWLAGNSGTIAG
ncbi:SRPBCC family protein [Pseudoxanthomonas japonensis]|nr:SRPBCC family protein [Pseudoxanthomonas japonensis]